MIQLLHGGEDSRAAARRVFICTSVGLVLAWAAAAALFPFALGLSRSIARTAVAALLYVVVVATSGAGVALLLLRSRVAGLQTKYAQALTSLLLILLWTVPTVTISRFRGLAAIFVIGAFAAAIARFLKLVLSFDREAKVEGGSNSAPALVCARGNSTQFIRLTGLVCLAYIGIAAEVSRDRTSALAFTALSWFLVAWRFDERRETEKALPTNRHLRVLGHTAAAVAITFLILLASVRSSSFGFSRTRSSERNYDSPEDQLHSGIILFSKKKSVVPLILPRSNSADTRLVRRLSSSMKIPFSGEYWFSRWPLLRPPTASLREEGNPATVNVTLEGFGSLIMQARQSIGRPLDVRCCHSISVVLHAADAQPEAVTMELRISDSSGAGHNTQTLGKLSLATPSDIFADAPTRMRGEIFRFEMPRHFAIRSFDSLEVWFHLNSPRAGQEAIASIDSFELIP